MTTTSSPARTRLSARHLSFGFGDQKVIDQVSFDLEPGSLTALVGPNGAGKSTLLHLLQGRLKPSSGSVVSDGAIALMPQRAAIDWTFPITVNQMVDLGRAAGSKGSATSCLDQVGLADLGARRLNQLSGGQQQRALLARTLVQNADILLLDEPCSAIDPPTREQLLGLMRSLAEAGQTLLISSHDWGQALDAYDRVIVLDGTTLAIGTPDDVRQRLSDMTCMGNHCCG
ncbi:metal ABC transporter ATP-binding protein [Parasynechococcus sp.]|uniref:metal ABC transporter ATP-binding protein n=1 Tax=Parasynechococcus sp. TaxID=3101203 RepID=UPI0037037F69